MIPRLPESSGSANRVFVLGLENQERGGKPCLGTGTRHQSLKKGRQQVPTCGGHGGTQAKEGREAPELPALKKNRVAPLRTKIKNSLGSALLGRSHEARQHSTVQCGASLASAAAVLARYEKLERRVFSSPGAVKRPSCTAGLRPALALRCFLSCRHMPVVVVVVMMMLLLIPSNIARPAIEPVPSGNDICSSTGPRSRVKSPWPIPWNGK